MKTFKIEKGIPIKRLQKPKKEKVKKVKKPKFKYPFADMVVGDSFFVKGNNKYKAVDSWRSWTTRYRNDLYTNIRNEVNRYIKHTSLSYTDKKSPIKFAIRQVKGGFRCWRTN